MSEREGDGARLVGLIRHTPDAGDAPAIARRLLERYGSAAAAMESDPEDLIASCGVRPRTAELICAVPSAARRALRDDFGKSPRLDAPERAREYVAALYPGVHRERLYLLCMDPSGKLINCAALFQGTRDESPFYPRLIAERAIRSGAAKVSLAHNHPDGTAAFSRADVRATRDAIGLLRAIGIPVLEHWLCAGGRVIGMRESGLIPEGEWAGEVGANP